MASSLIYSARFIRGHNIPGGVDFPNDNADPVIISSVFLHYGGNTPSFWNIVGDFDEVWIHADAPGFVSAGVAFYYAATRLHYVWEPGATIGFRSDANWDVNIHGYKFNP